MMYNSLAHYLRHGFGTPLSCLMVGCQYATYAKYSAFMASAATLSAVNLPFFGFAFMASALTYARFLQVFKKRSEVARIYLLHPKTAVRFVLMNGSVLDVPISAIK